MKRASSRVNLNLNAKYTIALIFSYEELNTNVLWNSVIWNLKKTLDINYVAYAPTGFHSLFFAADEIINIPSELNSFVRYQEVSEYFPKKTKIANKIRNIYRGIVQRVILKFNPTGSILLMILRTIAADRQLKFLYSSKTFKWIKEDFKTRSRGCDPFRILSGHSRANKLNKRYLIPVQNYLRFDGRRERVGLFVDHFSLNEDFKFLFGEHFEAISSGINEVFRNSKFSGLNVISQKQINIRTRNYQKKQPVHNTQLSDVLSITKILTGNNFQVTNIGSPPLSLKSYLSKEELMNYEEFDDLTLDAELKITSGPIICRADAGLFVLMSCLPNPLVLLSEEWSSFLGISLLEARKIAGFNTDQINLVEIQNKEHLLLSMHRYFEKEL